MPSSQILHVSAALGIKGTRERSSSRSDIIVDGVRAGAKRLGRKKERVTGSPPPQRPRAYVNHHERLNISQILPRHTRDDQPYVPSTKPYELSALATDLVVLARYLLKPSGRLVFFLPTVIDEYKELDLDSLLCDGMQVIANSLQDFGAWGRRVRVNHCRNTCRRSLLPLH